MDRASARHALLSSNVANINVPGYRRRDTDFFITLDRAVDAEGPRLIGWRALRRTATGGDARLDGNTVSLEREIVALAETQLRYQILTEITSNAFSGLKNVIREGR